MELNLATGRQKVKNKFKTRRPAAQEEGSIFFFLVLLVTVEDVLNCRPEILLVLMHGNFQQKLINKFIRREFFIMQQYFQ